MLSTVTGQNSSRPCHYQRSRAYYDQGHYGLPRQIEHRTRSLWNSMNAVNTASIQHWTSCKEDVYAQLSRCMTERSEEFDLRET